MEVEVAGRVVQVSNPDKVFFPQRGETKLDLIHYYLAVGEPLMRAMGGRPTLLQRFPDGAAGKSFFQKRVPNGAPDWLQTALVSTPNGTDSNALVAADLAHIVWAVNLGCLGFHPWPTHAGDPDHCDELRIDLDPGPGVTFEMVREAAAETRTYLAEIGITAYPKTTGNKGLHVYVRVEPGWNSYGVRQAAVAFARTMQERRPDLMTGEWWKENRGTRVFVDFNQNAPHKTVFGAWCIRSRVGGQVSMPFSWDYLAGIDHDEWTVATVPARLAERGDPWATMNDAPQSIEPLVERYQSDLKAGIPDAPWPPVYPKMPDEAPRVNPSRAKKE